MLPRRSPPIIKPDTEITENRLSRDAVVTSGRKFMLTLRQSVFEELRRMADQRGVTVQGLIRAVIVPEWHIEHLIVNSENKETGTETTERNKLMKQPSPLHSWPKTRVQTENPDPKRIIAQN